MAALSSKDELKAREHELVTQLHEKLQEWSECRFESKGEDEDEGEEETAMALNALVEPGTGDPASALYAGHFRASEDFAVVKFEQTTVQSDDLPVERQLRTVTMRVGETPLELTQLCAGDDSFAKLPAPPTCLGFACVRGELEPDLYTSLEIGDGLVTLSENFYRVCNRCARDSRHRLAAEVSGGEFILCCGYSTHDSDTEYCTTANDGAEMVPALRRALDELRLPFTARSAALLFVLGAFDVLPSVVQDAVLLADRRRRREITRFLKAVSPDYGRQCLSRDAFFVVLRYLTHDDLCESLKLSEKPARRPAGSAVRVRRNPESEREIEANPAPGSVTRSRLSRARDKRKQQDKTRSRRAFGGRS